MITNVLAVVSSLALVVSLGFALHAWFHLSLQRFHTTVARDVLTQWDAQLAEMSEFDREQQRAHPPVEVLEAFLDLPSRQPWRLELA